jgi:ribonuclease BN (tRNA processing enzyme)
MRLTVVGSSGSFPGPDSAASCYLVEVSDPDGRDRRLLLDLGSGALGPVQRFTSLAALDAVLLSHLHPDHFLDLCGLYVALRYAPGDGRPERLPVHGPTGMAERLAQAYGGDVGDDARPVFDLREWSPRRPVRIGSVTVTAVPVRHSIPAFGLRLEHRGRVLAYTGDTDSCPGLDELARGADLLLAEASFQEGRDVVRGLHLTGRRAGRAAAAAGVGRLVLTHIPPWTDPEVVLAEARAEYPGPVSLAVPGQTYQL